MQPVEVLVLLDRGRRSVVLPTLWTRSFYVESIGHISEDTIKRYIEDQKTA